MFGQWVRFSIFLSNLNGPKAAGFRNVKLIATAIVVKVDEQRGIQCGMLHGSTSDHFLQDHLKRMPLLNEGSIFIVEAPKLVRIVNSSTNVLQAVPTITHPLSVIKKLDRLVGHRYQEHSTPRYRYKGWLQVHLQY